MKAKAMVIQTWKFYNWNFTEEYHPQDHTIRNHLQTTKIVKMNISIHLAFTIK